MSNNVSAPASESAFMTCGDLVRQEDHFLLAYAEHFSISTAIPRSKIIELIYALHPTPRAVIPVLPHLTFERVNGRIRLTGYVSPSNTPSVLSSPLFTGEPSEFEALSAASQFAAKFYGISSEHSSSGNEFPEEENPTARVSTPSDIYSDDEPEVPKAEPASPRPRYFEAKARELSDPDWMHKMLVDVKERRTTVQGELAALEKEVSAAVKEIMTLQIIRTRECNKMQRLLNEIVDTVGPDLVEDIIDASEEAADGRTSDEEENDGEGDRDNSGEEQLGAGNGGNKAGGGSAPNSSSLHKLSSIDEENFSREEHDTLESDREQTNLLVELQSSDEIGPVPEKGIEDGPLSLATSPGLPGSPAANLSHKRSFDETNDADDGGDVADESDCHHSSSFSSPKRLKVSSELDSPVSSAAPVDVPTTPSRKRSRETDNSDDSLLEVEESVMYTSPESSSSSRKKHRVDVSDHVPGSSPRAPPSHHRNSTSSSFSAKSFSDISSEEDGSDDDEGGSNPVFFIDYIAPNEAEDDYDSSYSASEEEESPDEFEFDVAPDGVRINSRPSLPSSMRFYVVDNENYGRWTPTPPEGDFTPLSSPSGSSSQELRSLPEPLPHPEYFDSSPDADSGSSRHNPVAGPSQPTAGPSQQRSRGLARTTERLRTTADGDVEAYNFDEGSDYEYRLEREAETVRRWRKFDAPRSRYPFGPEFERIRGAESVPPYTFESEDEEEEKVEEKEQEVEVENSKDKGKGKARTQEQ